MKLAFTLWLHQQPIAVPCAGHRNRQTVKRELHGIWGQITILCSEKQQMKFAFTLWLHQQLIAVPRAGHRNRRTVKGVNFMGSGDSYVVSGSDCGHIYIWNKVTGRLEQWLKGDDETVNCLEPHPYTMLLATSGTYIAAKQCALLPLPFNNNNNNNYTFPVRRLGVFPDDLMITR
jgi:WD40 repeat protein